MRFAAAQVRSLRGNARRFLLGQCGYWRLITWSNLTTSYGNSALCVWRRTAVRIFWVFLLLVPNYAFWKRVVGRVECKISHHVCIQDHNISTPDWEALSRYLDSRSRKDHCRSKERALKEPNGFWPVERITCSGRHRLYNTIHKQFFCALLILKSSSFNCVNGTKWQQITSWLQKFLVIVAWFTICFRVQYLSHDQLLMR
jgi:hypothetical protein